MKNKIRYDSRRQKNLNSIRDNLKKIIKSQKNFNLRDLSRKLNKNDAYLQQYIMRGSPAFLPEEDRKKLSNILKIDAVTLTPKWLISKDDNNEKFFKIKNNINNKILSFPKDLLSKNVSNISSLIIENIKFTQNNIKFEMKVLVDTSINKFIDNNYYLLKDRNYLFLAHLNEYIQDNKHDEKIIVKPIDTSFNAFRINKDKISVFGKILFMSSFLKP